MKQKILIIVAGVLVVGGVGLYVAMQLRTTSPAAPSSGPLTDPTALEAAVKDRIETKAKLQAYKAQLAIYEKVLQHATGNIEAQKRVDTLRREIEALEKQNAPR